MKIATCCYCGTRAALVLDRHRHELACSACGAPLHEMKMMPQRPEAKPVRSQRSSPAAQYAPQRPQKTEKVKPTRRRKGLRHKIWEEIWDAVEDMFD
jgi:hypothetical protein